MLVLSISSVMHNQDLKASYCDNSLQDFSTLWSYCGRELLKAFENLLRPAELAKAAASKLRAIFILLYCTILAVGYSPYSGNIEVGAKYQKC
jgi:hypothetical protein